MLFVGEVLEMQKCFEIGKEIKASCPLDGTVLSKVFSGCEFFLVNVLFVEEDLDTHTGKNESLPRIVKNMVFLWKNFGILVEYRFSKESITLQRISNIWNYSNFGKLKDFCWSLTLEYLWNFCGNIQEIFFYPLWSSRGELLEFSWDFRLYWRT